MLVARGRGIPPAFGIAAASIDFRTKPKLSTKATGSTTFCCALHDDDDNNDNVKSHAVFRHTAKQRLVIRIHLQQHSVIKWLYLRQRKYTEAAPARRHRCKNRWRRVTGEDTADARAGGAEGQRRGEGYCGDVEATAEAYGGWEGSCGSAAGGECATACEA